MASGSRGVGGGYGVSTESKAKIMVSPPYPRVDTHTHVETQVLTQVLSFFFQKHITDFSYVSKLQHVLECGEHFGIAYEW